MTQANSLLLTSPAQLSMPAPENEYRGEFSFATAFEAVQAQAAQRLKTHGATPASSDFSLDTVKNREPAGKPAAEQRPSPSDKGVQEAPAKAEDNRLQSDRTTSQNTAPPTAQPIQSSASVQTAASVAPAIQVSSPGAPKLANFDSTVRNAMKADTLATPSKTIVKPAPAPTAAIKTFADVLAQKLDNGASRFELRLDPPELGRVEATLKLSPNGENVLALKFENQTALDFYEKDAALLHALLSDAGYDADRGDISFELKQSEVSNEGSDAAPHAVEKFSYAAPISASVLDIVA